MNIGPLERQMWGVWGWVGTRPWWLALLACGGAWWPLAFEPSAMPSRHPHYCGHPPAWGGIQNATSALRGVGGSQYGWLATVSRTRCPLLSYAGHPVVGGGRLCVSIEWRRGRGGGCRTGRGAEGRRGVRTCSTSVSASTSESCRSCSSSVPFGPSHAASRCCRRLSLASRRLVFDSCSWRSSSSIWEK